MINDLLTAGIIAIGLTAVTLGAALVIIKVKRARAKKRYSALIADKMRILAELQEELKDREESDQEVSDLPPQTPLPAQFFETNYTEVKA